MLKATKTSLSYLSSTVLNTKKNKKINTSEFHWTQITGQNLMWFSILLKSSRARLIIKGREKNNWLCFALPVKTREEKIRGFLPSSISFPACWQLYKSLWNNCVFLIKCEVVAIGILGFGTAVLCAFEDVSVRLICAPVHRVGGNNSGLGGQLGRLV